MPSGWWAGGPKASPASPLSSVSKVSFSSTPLKSSSTISDPSDPCSGPTLHAWHATIRSVCLALSSILLWGSSSFVPIVALDVGCLLAVLFSG